MTVKLHAVSISHQSCLYKINDKQKLGDSLANDLKLDWLVAMWIKSDILTVSSVRYHHGFYTSAMEEE